MTSSEVWVIKTILGGIAVLLALLAAILAFLDTLRGDKQEVVRAWFRARWQGIGRSRWMSMPRVVIAFLLGVGTKLSAMGLWFDSDKSCVVYPMYTIIALFVLPVGWWGCFNLRIAISICVFYVVAIAIVTLDDLSVIDLPQAVGGSLVLSMIVGMCPAAWGWLCLSLRLPLPYATLSMLLLLPVYWLLLLPAVVALASLPQIILLKLSQTTSRIMDVVALTFLFGVALSFTVTYLSLLIGHFARPSAPVPQNLQMLASNLLFDGFTMVATIMILKSAISKSGVLRIPLAIMLDIIVAAILACCSLYFGLVGSQNHLAVREVMSVLTGKSPSGSGWELGPYFWAMHTTFLPTAFYLSIILFCWLAKTVLTVAHWFFEKGQESKNPLKLTAAACGVMLAILSLAAYGAGVIEEHLKDKEKKAATKVIQRKETGDSHPRKETRDSHLRKETRDSHEWRDFKRIKKKGLP